MVSRLLNRRCLGRSISFATSITMFSVIGLLPLTVQAQFPSEPADFDRLLVGEMVVQGQANVNSNCKTGLPDCAGVLNVRFREPEINTGAGDGGADQLEVRIEARAGQAPIGFPIGCFDSDDELIATVTVPGAGELAVNTEALCTTAGGRFQPGTVSIDAPGNVMHTMGIQITYSDIVFANNLDPTSGGTPPCVGSVDTHTARLVADSLDPQVSVAASLRASAIEGYSIGSLRTGSNPATLRSDQVIQWNGPDGSYIEYMTLRCNLPTSYSNEMLGMSFQARAYAGVNSQHVGASGLQNLYVANARNSLEFFPLDRSNYITHAEITEDGQGVLIEYAQAVTDNSNQAYAILTSSGDPITPTIDNIIWLDDETVWLTLGDIYSSIGTVARSTTPLSADRHVLVSSRFPNDASFGNNFNQESTYRAVLTQHMSVADYAGTAPTITGITVGPGTESIAITFSEAVCHKTETGCGALTADSFDVKLYKGVISSTAEPIEPSISSFDLTGNVATLTFGSIGTLDGTERLLVRTARNSRFSDTFISDRTIFSQANNQIGMLHLQANALQRVIPTIRYELTAQDGDTAVYSSRELNDNQGSTATFTVTRTPTGYDNQSETIISITRDADTSANPDDFTVTADGTALTESSGVWETTLTFSASQNTKDIVIRYTGNDDPNTNYEYTIVVEPVSIPGGGSQQIAYTITDDEDDIDPTLPSNRAITAVPGATQVTLSFQSAYDTVGSMSDLSNVSYTRDVDYVFTFSRMNKQSVDQPITMSATELGLDFAEGNAIPASVLIGVGVTIGRADGIVFIPGDSYRVVISVIDRANRTSADSYSATFTMGTDVGDELAGVTCNIATGGTASDGDGDGVANAYERFIGTDCNNDPGAANGVDEYIGDADPTGVVLSEEMFNLTPPTSPNVVYIVEAGVSTYTAVDTGVTCSGTNCGYLKAFIVSSGLMGDDTADAVAMVTEICPDDASSGPGSCWVDDAYTDGNVNSIPLHLGYNLIDWIASDTNGNLLPNSKQTQLIYVAPTVVLNGATNIVLTPPSSMGEFIAQFAQADADSIDFIDGNSRTIRTLATDGGDFNCEPDTETTVTSITISSVSAPSIDGVYTYTAMGAEGDGSVACSLDLDGLMEGPASFMFDDDLSISGDFYIVDDNSIRISVADENNPVASSTMRETAPPIDSSNPNGNTNQLLTTVIQTQTVQNAIEVPTSYDVRLGGIATTNNHTVSDLDLGDDIVGDIGTPPGYEDEGVFEFNTYLPDNVNTAYAAIPLANPIPGPKGYYKFITTNGVSNWRPFERDSNNEYWSAPGTVAMDGSVTCPPPVPSGAWGGPGILSAGDQCVLLQMTDDGNNDADGELNAVVADPGAPGTITFPFINMGDRSFTLPHTLTDAAGRSYILDIDSNGGFVVTDTNDNPIMDSNGNRIVVTQPDSTNMPNRYSFTLLDGTVIVFDYVPSDPITPPGRRRAGSGIADFWFLAALLGLVALPPMIRRYRLRQ